MGYLKQIILEVFQSGFKTLHCKESALLRVFNDIFLATDPGKCVIFAFRFNYSLWHSESWNFTF